MGNELLEFLIVFRAHLLQVAKGLELQRSGILATVAFLEKEFNLKKGDSDERRKENTTVSDKVQSREDIR